MMKKRFFISTALAMTIIAITGAGLLEHRKTTAETQRTCLPELLLSEKAEAQERIVTEITETKSVAETTISDAPKNNGASTLPPFETTIDIDPALPVVSESAVPLEETISSTGANEPFTPPEQTTDPPKPVQIQPQVPKHGDINERGEMYINGFGWVASEGTNSCEYSAEMYMNGNKIGYFG